MLIALELRTDMVEGMPDALLLQKQQEQRQQRCQDNAMPGNAARHEAQINGRDCAWQSGLRFADPEIWPAGDGIGAATCLRAGAPVRASSAQMRLYRIGHRSHVFYRLAQFFC